MIRWPFVRRSRLVAAEALLKHAETRVFYLRDAIASAQWRVAMNLSTIDQQAANRILAGALEKDTERDRAAP